MVQVNVVSSWSSPLKLQVKFASSGVPRPKENPKVGFFVYLLTFTAVIGGFLFGYDASVVSSALLFVPRNGGMRPMDSIWQEIVVSVAPGEFHHRLLLP